MKSVLNKRRGDKLLLEVLLRTNLIFPETQEEDRVFEEGVIQSDFLPRAYSYINKLRKKGLKL